MFYVLSVGYISLAIYLFRVTNKFLLSLSRSSTSKVGAEFEFVDPRPLSPHARRFIGEVYDKYQALFGRDVYCLDSAGCLLGSARLRPRLCPLRTCPHTLATSFVSTVLTWVIQIFTLQLRRIYNLKFSKSGSKCDIHQENLIFCAFGIYMRQPHRIFSNNILLIITVARLQKITDGLSFSVKYRSTILKENIFQKHSFGPQKPKFQAPPEKKVNIIKFFLPTNLSNLLQKVLFVPYLKKTVSLQHRLAT